ncbi:AcrR family transcriptional regulator [Actinopolyspora lacussalsi]|uniref:Transcriptional regulator, TetR family n=2 Tax=Actinopolyspora alba group TaxID=2893675 RepID=A0A1I1VEK3_9ACTN|nr:MULTISPECIES: TetR/AcrR family transcriptional regulator [Actinopolyspora alba group]MDP9640601.1 AcrR family transcriptional regulator [Actinopolyspora lacussalsi]SFD81205.1 transcriptional regulator, TetR family [Actinopolyspora alba]SFT64910.1 transcriptional regulator, TetR family [Actinopolyspora righensis]
MAPSSFTEGGGETVERTRHSGQEPVPQRLLSAATRLFAEQGFETTSVQQIVDAAGVTKGAMYHYFGSKDDLLYEIYARVLRVQMSRMEQAADSSESVERRLRAVAADVVVTTVAYLEDTVIFFRSMHLLHSDKQAEVRAQRRRYHERVKQLIEEGQRAGVFRADRSPELVVDFFFGAVHHLGSWYRRDGPMSGEQVGDQFADLLLDALRA